MKKKDLKNGMYVKTRNENVYIVMNDYLCRNSGYAPLDAYNEDLTCCDTAISELDIIEVYTTDDPSINFAIDYSKERIWCRPNTKTKLSDIKEGDIFVDASNSNDKYLVYKVNYDKDTDEYYCDIFNIDDDNNYLDTWYQDNEISELVYIDNDQKILSVFNAMCNGLKSYEPIQN